MNAIKAWVRALNLTQSARQQTLPALFDSLVENYGDNVALLDSNETLTYRELYQRSNQIARFAKAHGLNSGSVVCLLMPNRPDYVAIWLALTRIGCTVALLNTNLRGDALLHCIRVAQAAVLIVADVNHESLDLPVRQIWNWPLIQPETERFSAMTVDAAYPRPDERALLIYTSGTTGLPKATNITHRRIMEWSYWFAGMIDTQPTDRIYNCLPMYHSIGGVVAVGSMLVKGGSVFIRERFSASQFWDDICDHNCTIFQYIGELCRYLTKTDSNPRERDHLLRLAVGNGMHGEVWEEFQKRFAIPHVLEFYAATEGNLSLYNVEGKVGAIGRVPPFLAQHFSVAILRCDMETGEPVRGDDGFCLRCDDGEPGEAVSNLANRRFDGYTNAEASDKKILRNVFAAGDAWFRSGDLLRKDAAGYFYFVDRLGDTFRWKGENVSTTEVASVLRTVPGVTDAVVYGVTIPGNEGRAGMAAISVTGQFEFTAMSRVLRDQLPTYAHPLFVRVCETLTTTGTFKLSKTELAREGYTGTTDPIWTWTQSGDYTTAAS